MYHHDWHAECWHAEPLLECRPSVSPIGICVALPKRVEKGAVPAARSDYISMQSACNQHAISMPSACHQHAISMQPAPECNQHATREQSACSQGALGVREMGEEPSECNQHAIRMQSACNQHACSAYGKWEKSHSGARRSLAGGADALWGTLSVACETESSACTQHALGLSMALSMHSACNQISILARRRPRGPACTGAPGASTADRGAAASSCA